MAGKDKRTFGGRFLYCRFLACETVAGAEAPATDDAAELAPPDNGETGNQQEGQGEVKQPNQPENDGYNPEWYKTDGRVGKMWKSQDVRDDIVKSYFHLEKQYKPLSDKVKSYDMAFGELGLKGIDDVKNIIAEYQKFQDPENPLIQRASLFSKFYDDPLYQSKVENFFQELQQAELQHLYPNMNAQQIQEHMTIKAELEELKAERSKQQNEAYIAGYKKQLGDDTERNKKYAESIGLSYTPEIHNACVDYVMKHDRERGYPISLTQAFREIYEKQIGDALTQKIEADVLKRKSAKPDIIQGSTKNETAGAQTVQEKNKSLIGKIADALMGDD